MHSTSQVGFERTRFKKKDNVLSAIEQMYMTEQFKMQQSTYHRQDNKLPINVTM